MHIWPDRRFFQRKVPVVLFFATLVCLSFSGCSASPFSSGRPQWINAYYYGHQISLEPGGPHYDALLEEVEKALRRRGTAGSGNEAVFPEGDKYMLFGLEICFSEPVTMRFGKEKSVQLLFIDLTVPQLFTAGAAGEPYRPGAYPLEESAALLEAVERYWREIFGVTHPLEPDTIREVRAEFHHPQRLDYRIALSGGRDFGPVVAAFNGIVFCEPPAQVSPQVRMNIIFHNDTVITVEDTGTGGVFKIDYRFAPVHLSRYGHSPELAAFFDIFREQLGEMKLREEPPGPFKPQQVRFGGKYELYPGPDPVTMNRPPRGYGEIAGGSMVEMLERIGEWVRVRSGDSEGWIPRWYLSEDASEPVADVAMGFKVLNGDIAGRLYPDGPEIDYWIMSAGIQVKPLKEWSGWYEVGRFTFSAPGIHTAWIPKSLVSEKGAVESRIGVLKTGAIVFNVREFDRIGQAKAEPLDGEMIVLIGEKREGYVLVESHGGWAAWTREENLSHDLDHLWEKRY